MNNLDYLEYEGSRLLDYAMKTYSKTSTGSLENDIERAVLAGQKELSLAEQDALQSLSFEYNPVPSLHCSLHDLSPQERLRLH